MFPLFLRPSDRNALDSNGPYVYKPELDNNKKCLSVGNFGILSVVLTRLRPTKIMQRLEIFTKKNLIYPELF